MYKQIISYFFITSLFLLSFSCSSNNPINTVENIDSNPLVGTLVNIVDTVWAIEIRRNGNGYDTTYIPQKPSHYWDTITFIDSKHCITGSAIKDTQTYWFEDTLSTRWIVIYGLENNKWLSQSCFPFEMTGSCISMKPFIYSKILD